MAIVPKMIYGLNAIPIKIPRASIAYRSRKFIFDTKELKKKKKKKKPQKSQGLQFLILKPTAKLHIKIVWCWHKERDT